MKHKPYLAALVCLLVCSCISDSLGFQLESFHIKGGQITDFHSSSRSLSAEKTIASGSILTFYSQGGIHADEMELTYNGTYWEGDSQIKWENTQQPASITAFCPPLYRNQTDFYSNGMLRDQLMAQKEYAYGDDITLSFHHLFAQIRFEISDKLNLHLQQIEFTPSLSVSAISPESASLSYQQNQNPLRMTPHPDGTYTFLLPPTSLSINICMYMDNGTIYEKTLNNYSFSAGYSYMCPIKSTDEMPGIFTTEDFIAFTHLINGESYKDRSLEEFGTKNGETTLYTLCNDLTFTPEESAEIQMIGKYGSSTGSQKRLFNDTFDGQGHSLNNLNLEKPVDGYYYSGIFSGLSATGVVKNLIINQAVYNNPEDTNRASFLVGINKGKIENCQIHDCTIQSADSRSEFGGISCRNEGLILNCHVNKIYLKVEINYGNGITRYNYDGKILNCAVTNCNFSKTKFKGGLICNKIQNGEIQNCYLYGNTGNYHAISLQALSTNVIRCCFYPQTDSKEPVGNNYVSTPSDSLMPYGSNTSITSKALPQIMNQWVMGTGPRLHPTLSFCLWEKGENLPAILVSP